MVITDTSTLITKYKNKWLEEFIRFRRSENVWNFLFFTKKEGRKEGRKEGLVYLNRYWLRAEFVILVVMLVVLLLMMMIMIVMTADDDSTMEFLKSSLCLYSCCFELNMFYYVQCAILYEFRTNCCK